MILGALDLPSACDGSQEAGAEQEDTRGLAWPAVACGKRSRSRHAGSPSTLGSAASTGAAAASKEEGAKQKKPRRGAFFLWLLVLAGGLRRRRAAGSEASAVAP